MKNKFYHSDFSFFCDVIFRVWIGVENFIKNHFRLVPRAYKHDLLALILRYVVDSVNVNMRVSF